MLVVCRRTDDPWCNQKPFSLAPPSLKCAVQFVLFVYNNVPRAPSVPLPPHTHTHTHTAPLCSMSNYHRSCGQWFLQPSSLIRSLWQPTQLRKACSSWHIAGTPLSAVCRVLTDMSASSNGPVHANVCWGKRVGTCSETWSRMVPWKGVLCFHGCVQFKFAVDEDACYYCLLSHGALCLLSRNTGLFMKLLTPAQMFHLLNACQERKRL